MERLLFEWQPASVRIGGGGAGAQLLFSICSLPRGLVPSWPGRTPAQPGIRGRGLWEAGKGLVGFGQGTNGQTCRESSGPNWGGPSPFPAPVSGKMGSGTHPPMLPSSSDFQGLDFIAFLSSLLTHQIPRRLQHTLVLDLWGHRLGPWVSRGMRWVRDHLSTLRIAMGVTC